MAKKMKAAEVAVKKDSVRVGISYKPSRNFSSFGFDMGVELSVGEKETTQKALDRAVKELFEAVDRHQEKSVEQLVQSTVAAHEKAAAFDKFGR